MRENKNNNDDKFGTQLKRCNSLVTGNPTVDMSKAHELDTIEDITGLHNMARKAMIDKEKAKAVLSKREKIAVLIQLPPKVQDLIKNPHGKPNCNQSFKTEAAFRHTFFHLFDSGFLDDKDVATFRKAGTVVAKFLDLRDDYMHVDFSKLKNNNGFIKDWETTRCIDPEREVLMSAAVMYYKGDIASVAKYIQGPYTCAHRNVPMILQNVRGKIEEKTYEALAELLTNGAPKFCNAETSDQNWWEYMYYDNHPTVASDTRKTYKTIVKDTTRGNVLYMDPRLIYYIPNSHKSPIGITDLDSKYKKPRMFFDASFRPNPWSTAINDMTTHETEFPLQFQHSFNLFLQWIWNL